jgi:predicted DNA-binding transcriptional regulator YafY
VNRYDEERQVTIRYTNHRGEYGERRILPIKIWFGTSPWHPEPQWLLKAIDIKKDDYRDFALRCIDRSSFKAVTAVSPPPSTFAKDLVQAVAREFP